MPEKIQWDVIKAKHDFREHTELLCLLTSFTIVV